MGKIYMKAVQQQVFNLNNSGNKSFAYVLRPSRYSTIDSKQIVEYCTQNSMVPKAYINGAMIALAQCITNFLLNGHSVVFPNLGTFSLTSSGYAEGDVDKAGLDQLKKLNVRFLPCTDLKTVVENVDVELDGVFDIAGETVLEEATETRAAKTKKYYRRVNRTLTVDSEGNEVDDEGGGSSTAAQKTISLSIPNAMLAMGDIQINTRTKAKSDSLTVDAGTSVTIKATPANADYQFTGWSDGETDATRSITVNEDISLTAQFSPAE